MGIIPYLEADKRVWPYCWREVPQQVKQNSQVAFDSVLCPYSRWLYVFRVVIRTSLKLALPPEDSPLHLTDELHYFEFQEVFS